MRDRIGSVIEIYRNNSFKIALLGVLLLHSYSFSSVTIQSYHTFEN